jgi:CheY-like chemotaxis protein
VPPESLWNALKFTRQGRVEIAVDLLDEMLRFRVSDTGIGISREQIDKLFTEFQQADATIAREFGGTGLGLSITRKFVEMHGATYGRRANGKGSTFFFSILARERHDDLMSPKTILYVEDNELNRRIVRDLLKRTSYRLLEAPDGETSLDIVRREHPDLILMDIQLPRLSGIEVTRTLRSEPTTANTPIIAITSFALSGDEQRAKEAGATSFL